MRLYRTVIQEWKRPRPGHHTDNSSTACTYLCNSRAFWECRAHRGALQHCSSCHLHGMCNKTQTLPVDRSEPLHTQATRSDLASGWELNVRPLNWWERTSVFDYTPILLVTLLSKVLYINLLHVWLMRLMRVSCDCAIDVICRSHLFSNSSKNTLYLT